MSTKEEKPQTAAEMLESGLTFIRRAFAFWKRSMLVFIIVAGVSVPMVFLKARNYRSETIVLYQEKLNKEVVTGGENSGDGAARRAAARLKENLLSRASLEPIVKDLPRYNALAERRGMVDAVEELRSHITFHAREGDTFEVGYEGISPQEAQDVTRRLGDAIVTEAAKKSEEQSKATTAYLDVQSEQNKEKLRKAEAELWTFLGIHPEFIPQLQPGRQTVVVTNNPNPTVTPGKPAPREDPVLAALQAEERNLEARIRAGKGEAPAPPPSPREESEEVKAARKELAEKRAQFTEQHPDVVAAKRKLQAAIDADHRKHGASQPAVPSGKLSDAEIAQLESRLAIVRRSIANHHPPKPGTASANVAPASSNSTVAAEVEFRRLQREVENLREAQKQLDDKLFKARLQGGSMIEVKIVDPAYLPAHPSSKPRSTALAMYLGIGVALAILLALVSARLDDRIYQRRDLEMLDILPVMGVIPKPGGRKR